MLNSSTLDQAVQLGARVVDLDTGELLYPARTAGDEDTRAGGLSNPHICTQEGTLSLWIGGGLMQCSKPVGDMGKVIPGGKRGKVTRFSAASRRRMLYTLGKIQRAKLPLLVTLTYPLAFPADGARWKSHLRRWYQRLERKVPGVGCIWKLEPQKRGAPHFHLLIWGLDGVPLAEFRSWASKSWYQVVGSEDEKHLRAGTRVEIVRDRNGMMAYASKYLGKVLEDGDLQGWDQPGRFWGVKGADNIPWADLFTCAVSYGQAVKLLRYMRRYIRCKRGGLPGLSILTNPDYWFERLEKLWS